VGSRSRASDEHDRSQRVDDVRRVRRSRRLVSRAHTQGKPYVTYDYDWTAPRPKTTTHLFEADESTLTPFTGWQPGSGWRESVEITTGSGEHLYTATRLASDRLTVDQWTVRDDRGKSSFAASRSSTRAPICRRAAGRPPR